MNDEDHGFELVVPFVVTESNGGIFLDGPYVAGWEAGRIAGLLEAARQSTNEMAFPIHADNLPQIDLFAMRYGWSVETEDVGDGWAWATLRRGES